MVLDFKRTDTIRERNLRVAYLIDKPLSESAIDPAKIELVKQANLIRALYGRLVEFTNTGEIIPSLAESFDISGDTIKFKIKKDLQTISGIPITSRDIGLSLKRLLVLKSNLHASLEQFLCGKEITAMEDDCPGIGWDTHSLILKLRETQYSQFLIPLLANVDFSIIPENSIDWKKPNLPIINWHETSGAYYVLTDYSDGQIILEQNKNNPNLLSKSPTRITLIKAGFDQAHDLFMNNKVDFIPTIYQFSEEFIKNSSAVKTDLHESFPIRIWFAKFYRKNNKYYTQSELKYIAHILKNNLPKEHFDYGFNPTNKLFPHLSEADLDDHQNKLFEKFWNTSEEKVPKRKFKVWVPTTKLKPLQEAFKKFPFIEFYYDAAAPWNLPEDQKPDAIIIAMDSTFFEDLSVINYNFSMGFFGYSKESAQKWIQNYINTKDKASRISLLRKLHFEMLTQIEIVPLGFTPYIAISRNDWKINFSKYYAGSPLWSVTHQ